MKKILVLTILVLFLLTHLAYPQQYWRAINHSHDTNSDGTMSSKKLLKETLTRKIPVLVITNHLSCLVGKCDAKDHKHSKNDFSQDYFGKAEKKFKLYQEFQGTGLGKLNYTLDTEVFTDIDSAHILFLNLDPNITNRDDFKNLNWQPPQKIVDYIKNNNGIAVLAHPHWMKEKTIPTGLDGLEFFNTKGYNLTSGVGKFEMAENIDLEIYCNLIKEYLNDPENNQLPAITAGCDVHALPAELNFGHTFFWGNEPTIANLYQAIKNGQTFAVMGSGFEIKIKTINYPPSKNINKIDTTVKITGELAIKIDSSMPTGYIKLYRDGEAIDQKLIKLYGSKFTLNFKDDPPPGRHVYFLYSPIRFITSPIIFEVIESSAITPQPNTLPPAGPEAISNRLPSISPDGQWVAYVNNEYGNNEIFLVNINSLRITRLTNNPANDTHPTWHPNNCEVFFQSDRNGKSNIWSVNIFNPDNIRCYTQDSSHDCFAPNLTPYNELFYRDGEEIKWLTFAGYPAQCKSKFAPPGKTIFFNRNGQIIAKRNNLEQFLTPSDYQSIFTSQVENFLLYCTNRNGNYDIYAMREDGQKDLPLIVMEGDQKYSTGILSRDRFWLVFESNHLSNNPDQYDIYLKKFKTDSGLIRLTDGDLPL